MTFLNIVYLRENWPATAALRLVDLLSMKVYIKDTTVEFLELVRISILFYLNKNTCKHTAVTDKILVK